MKTLETKIMTESEFAAAARWVGDNGLPSSVNAISDIASEETIFLNGGERWGDGYWYVKSEVAGMIESCGWEGTTVDDVLSDGVEVPREVVELSRLKPVGMKWKMFESLVSRSDSLTELGAGMVDGAVNGEEKT